MKKITLVAGAVGICAIASAQVLSPDVDMTIQALHTFQPSSALAGTTMLLNTKGRAVGFGNPLAFSGPFAGVNSAATAQTVFGGFRPGTAVGAGQDVQLGLYSFGVNAASATAPVRVFLSIFQHDASVVTGVPIGAPVVRNIPVDISSNLPNPPAARTYWTGRFTLPSALLSNQRYWLAVSPATQTGASAPATWALAVTNSFAATGLGAQGFSASEFGSWLYRNNSSDLGTGSGLLVPSDSPNVLAMRIVAAPAPMVITLPLQFDGAVASFIANRPMRFSVTQGTATIVSTTSFTATSSSQTITFTIPASVTGTVSISVDGSQYLRRRFNATMTGSSQTLAAQVLKPGDVDNNGEVDLTDIDLAIGNYLMSDD